ncbi:hypothetical protein NKG05_22250 [Oerskovia sp. M15]
MLLQPACPERLRRDPEVLAHLARHARLRGLKDPAGREAVAARLDAIRAAVSDESFSVGLSGDLAMLDGAFTTLPTSDAWHTGIAALAPHEYAQVRRAHIARRPLDAVTERSWLLAVAREVARLRPVSGLHALAGLLGVPTGPLADRSWRPHPSRSLACGPRWPAADRGAERREIRGAEPGAAR